MAYRKIQKQSKEALSPFGQNYEEAAKAFGVSSRTIVRWMDDYGIYQPKRGYGRGKLNIQKADHIRKEHKSGNSVQDLANKYEVTPSTIGRVIHNISYSPPKYEMEGTAVVSVIYNA